MQNDLKLPKRSLHARIKVKQKSVLLDVGKGI